MHQIIKAIPEGGKVTLEISRDKNGENIQVVLHRKFPDAKTTLLPMLVVGTEAEIADEINAAIRAYRVGTDSIMQQVEHALAASQKEADKKISGSKADTKADAKADTKADAKADTKADTKADATAEAKTETEAEAKADSKLEGAADLFA